MKIIIIGLLILLGFRGFSVGMGANGGGSGALSGLFGNGLPTAAKSSSADYIK